MIGRMAIHADSSRLGLIRYACSVISWAAYSASVAALLENSSLRSRAASFQSSTAVTFEMTSAHPEARRRNGACDDDRSVGEHPHRDDGRSRS